MITLSFTLTMWDVNSAEMKVLSVEEAGFTLTMWDVN